MKIDREAYEEILPKLKSKRARRVLTQILENGSVSTYELRQMGYSHPPRAAQDLKECGIALKTVFSRHPETGNRMGNYELAAPAPITGETFSGRGALPRNLENQLYDAYGARCNLDGFEHSRRTLQADHRIPFIVAGDPEGFRVADWQLLCASHQRKKSFECENCDNSVTQDPAVCQTCFWAFPEDYSHVAMREERRVTLVWSGEDIDAYERIRAEAERKGIGVPAHIREHLDSE